METDGGQIAEVLLQMQDTMTRVMERMTRLEAAVAPTGGDLLDVGEAEEESSDEPLPKIQKPLTKQQRSQARIRRLTMTPRAIRQMSLQIEEEYGDADGRRTDRTVRILPMTTWPTVSGNQGEEPVSFLAEFEEIVSPDERSEEEKLTLLARCLREREG